MTGLRWPTRKLDELGFVGRGKSKHRPRNDPALYGGSYPFFQTGDIKSAQFHLTRYSQTYNEKGLAQSKLWNADTLCITIAANIAETAILGIPGCFPDSVVGFVADPDKADVRFVKYYIDLIKLEMQNVSKGTTQDNLSVDKLLSFDFRVPPLPVQQRIAGILAAYDDLIENCERRIRVLDEMARALYREWFVHFRYPGHENVPLVESVLGPRPATWQCGTLGEMLNLHRGYDLPERERCPGDVPIVSSSGTTGFHNVSKVEPPGVVTGRYGTLGEVFLISRPFWPLNTTLYVSDFKDTDPYYALFLLRSLNLATQNAAGAVPGVNRNALHLLPLLVPNHQTRSSFGQIARDALVLTESLHVRAEHLRKTRDLLLPRLLSGQLEVGVVG